MQFLPVNMADMRDRGWEQTDFVLVTGDAYVDHPSFGVAIISRLLEARGFRVAVLSQPDWRSATDFQRFGRPRLGFLVSGGNIDSMVAHYTAAKRKRSDDAYSPGNRAGKRPDRALSVYCQKIRGIFPDIPIIIGGLEASLRRFAHYDYWSDSVMPSVLYDCKADLLVYGMGERQILEIAKRLDNGQPVGEIIDVRGTCYLCGIDGLPQGIEVAPLKKCRESKREYAIAARMETDEQDARRGRRLIQRHGEFALVQSPPMPPLDTETFDMVYSLPYMRTYHPMYERMGGVPAIEEVEFSLVHNRGCFGACNFCSLAFHQGRQVAKRSKRSLIIEAEKLRASPRFKGYIHDVGGPTANFRQPSCEAQLKQGLCKGKKCLAPTVCKAVVADHGEYLDILRELRALPGVKKVFIRSGIRFDYLMHDKNESFFRELVEHHISGQLKVAPEHCSNAVLDCMGKPHIEVYKRFSRRYFELTKKAGKRQYLVPYLMSSHPGSTLKDAVELAVFLKNEGIRPEQVQDFYPTPGTISTAMYYTGLDPYTLKPVDVPRTREEKDMQRALLQYYKPQNKAKVLAALKQIGRPDLISCLITGAGSARLSKKSKRS